MSAEPPPANAAWNSVYAVGFGVAGLTAAEMLPVSLLTPIAADLRISEGLTGQAVTATALIALAASLLTAVVTRGLNRRTLLLILSTLQVASGLIVAFAPSFGVLMVGRLLLGLPVGGFWAMSAALAMRLVPENAVPKAFAIIFGGVSIATIAAAPIGSFLGGIIGWRGVFLLAASMAVIGLIWQALTLPSMPPRGRPQLATLLHLLRKAQVRLGLLGVILVFGGHFAFFTYLRPFLETVTHLDVTGVSEVLLTFGTGCFVGTTLAGWLIARSLRLILALVPLCQATLGLLLILMGSSFAMTAVAVALWGFAFGTVPVAWSTWLTRAAPDDAESGGGLLVAAIQIAISAGASLGGVVFNHSGAQASFGLSAALLIAAALMVILGVNREDDRSVAMTGSTAG